MHPIDFLAFGWKYYKILLEKPVRNQHPHVKKITYITHENTEKWILGAKARRLARYSKLNATVSYTSNFKDFDHADGFFFLHPNIFAKSIRKNAHILKKKNIVMFTHPVLKNRFSIRHRIFVLNLADKVIFLNRNHADLMIHYGLQPEKAEIMHLASDADMFQPHERANGKVCLSMAYYERKNPQLMLDIIKKMPHRNFMLIGPGWNEFIDSNNLCSLSNFEYRVLSDYKEYPGLYEQCDVFLSTSKLEGGPVPLLETMLCNMVPVVSRTGYCTDIIEHGENGFLFDTGAKAEDVIPLIDKAFEMKVNTRDHVKEFTWEKYSSKIDEIFLARTGKML